MIVLLPLEFLKSREQMEGLVNGLAELAASRMRGTVVRE